MNAAERGELFIVSGPSGSGKSSLCDALLKQSPNLYLSISCTTREPRPGEADGREYHFLTRELFEAERGEGAFLEWADVHGNLYGTRKPDVEAALDSGLDILLEIDWQGAAQVAEKIEGAFRIFIMPPTLEVLKERLILRGQDDASTVEKRFKAAESEMQHAGEAHYQIVNDRFEDALEEIQTIYENNHS
ncbi:MAG: guanylate kinase [Mariprofundaceae bacterium]|nr:guanylate kinase [Mariprofundaceae bacterium]